MEQRRIGVVFVCLGNICRSPLAEAVFRAAVGAEGLGQHFLVDSAGTSDYHAGESPDPRTVEVARRRGVAVEHRARQFQAVDFDRFDYVIAMDTRNLERVRELADRVRPDAEVRLLREFEDGAVELDVPDPYFGGPRGFEDVHDVIERACRGLLAHIRAEHDL